MSLQAHGRAGEVFPCAFCRRTKPTSRWTGSSLKRGCGDMGGMKFISSQMCNSHLPWWVGMTVAHRWHTKWSDWSPVIWDMRYCFFCMDGIWTPTCSFLQSRTVGSSLGALPQMRFWTEPTREVSTVPIGLSWVLQRALLWFSGSVLGTAASERTQPRSLWLECSPAKQETCFTESY